MAKRPPAVLSTGSVASEVSLLFRTKRVSDIRRYEHQIRHEADDKSDALRDLLGTRYRDLLRAADATADIRDAASARVRDALRALAADAALLRDRLHRHAARAPAPAADDLDRRRAVHHIGRVLKHIVDTPEVLYACLEAGAVYDAARRYSLAAADYEEVARTSGLERVANRFADRRWRQVHVFKPQILAAAETRLVTPRLRPRDYAEALASLAVLTDACDIVALLNGMLAARTAWVDDEHRAATGASARLCAVARVVRSTISCATDLLWRGAVDALLRGVDDPAAETLRAAREDGSLSAAVVSWTQGVRAWLDDNGPAILAEASSSRALADTLKAVDGVFDADGWDDDCRLALNQPPSFVFDIFKPFISKRAGVVASECIERAVGKVLSDIDDAWGDFELAPHAGKLVWSAVSNQTAGFKASDADARDEKENAEDDVDLARILSSQGQVSLVLGTFEASLKEALDDATVLTQRIPSVAASFDKSVRSSLPTILGRLRERLDSVPRVAEQPSPTEQSHEQLMQRALFVARAATMLGGAECVKSAYCFSAVDEKKSRSNSALKEFQQTASELSSLGYATWANRLCAQLRTELLSDLTSAKILAIPMGWTTGQDVFDSTAGSAKTESALRYPATASTAVFSFMLKACEASNRAGGFALPFDAILFLRQEMTAVTVEAYKTVLQKYTVDATREPDNDPVSMKGNEATDVAVMQMLFDVLVLQQLFAEDSHVSQSPTTRPLKTLESTIEASVDPIDLAACRKAMQESVLNYVSRTGTLLGTITRSSSGQQATVNRPMTSLTAASNLVTLSHSVPRFTYLPAPMPSTYSASAGGTAGLNAKAAIEMLRTEAAAANGSSYRKRESDISVAGYASKVSESVGRFGRGFFESLTRNVG